MGLIRYGIQNPGMSFNPIRKIGAQFLEALKNHGKIDESQATKQILDIFADSILRDVSVF